MNCFRNKPARVNRVAAIWWLGTCAAMFVLLSLILVAGTAPVALAQGTQPPPTPTPTPPPVTTVISRAAPIANSTHLVILVIATLVFAMLALVVVFLYMYRVQSHYYDVADSLGRLGQTVNASVVQAFAAGSTDFEAGGDTDKKTVTLALTGPGVVEVGRESEEFTVTLSDGTAAESAVWTVEPKIAAAIRPSTSGSMASVKVTPAVAGAFTLNARCQVCWVLSRLAHYWRHCSAIFSASRLLARGTSLKAKSRWAIMRRGKILTSSN